MPKHLGKKAKRIAEAAQRENAALAALQTANGEQVVELAQELAQARAEKDSAKAATEDSFVCGWCRDGKDKSGHFHNKARIVLEVTGVFVFDSEGESVSEHRSREQPVYLVGCRGCMKRLGLVEHLME